MSVGGDEEKTRSFSILSNGTMVSHYRIIEKIGAGGMGEVYLAEDTQLNRKIALKFLPPHLCQDADCRARFKREAQAAAKLDHPNIVTVHEVCEYQDRPFFSMQHVEGQSLKEVIAGKILPLERIVDIAVQVCEGLQAAHQKGITHRDIKPSNILIDSHGRARIVDFGLASVLGSEQLTKTGSTLGTIGYMSPEQVRGEAADHRTDLFSLGVVLYELVTGHSPFKCDTEAATLHAITNTNPEPLARFRREVPPGLQAIIDKALDKKVTTRYQHADDLQTDLVRLKESLTPIRGFRMVPSRKARWLGLAGALVVLSGVVLLLARPWPVKPVKPGEKIMLAVLPFQNLGPVEQNYFSDGVTEEIITKLTKVGGLGVISRTSAMTYKNTQKSLRQIGSELGVGYILEGTIRWERAAGVDHVRINPQLIRVKDDSHVWAETYDRALTEVFAVQSEIAQQVSEALGTSLLGARGGIPDVTPTTNLSAYDFYLRGKEYDNSGPRGWLLAQKMYERAIEQDSTFALGWAMLARMHAWAYWAYFDHTSTRPLLAKVCAERSVSLDPKLPEAHEAMGIYYYWGNRVYDSALACFNKALELRPNDADIMQFVAYVKRRLSRWNECLSELEECAEYDPRNSNVTGEIFVTHLFLRQYREADLVARRHLALNPDDADVLFKRAAMYILADGNVDRAKALADSLPLRNYVPDVSLCWSAEMAMLGMLNDFRHKLVAQMSCEMPVDSLARYLRAMLPYRPVSESATEYIIRTAYADSARALITRFLQDLPNDPEFHGQLGLTLAVAGHFDRAIREGEWAVDALPVSKDAINGAGLVGGLAVIYVLAGKYDAAIDKLDQLLSIPGYVSIPLLRVDPTWAPLRSNPRFQKLLEKYGT